MLHYCVAALAGRAQATTLLRRQNLASKGHSEALSRSSPLLLNPDWPWQDIGFGWSDHVIWEDGPVHAEDRGHQRHIVVAPDTAVIVDDVGWYPNDPKWHMNTYEFVMIRYKPQLPGLWLRFWTGGRRSRLLPSFRSSLRALGSTREENTAYWIVLQVVIERIPIARESA